ncbi:hypothetical protein M5K25_010769 [Dendrobium thyrsiflorum]|uniref:DUF4220 domain-containing protein n=1 Tax=Dendrobium thyrsiflorum TaxID=117978 RepID=A0ABD0V869_DENTH
MEIPLKYKQLWNKWDVRVLILLSLSIQIILIFLSRLRRTSTSRWIRMVLWANYLFANWIADFVLGQLSSTMDDSSPSNVVIAFWAPFLILHLGGPDTITAYSMEDNELWARHLLGLGYELFIAFYVLFRSLPNTRLLIPTLLIFLVAIIKYVERSYSLYKASVEGIRSSIKSFDRILPTKDLNALSQAFWLYSATKPSFIDAIPYFDEYEEIRDIVKKMTTKEVLMIMRMELGYAYDEFYTKAVVNHSKPGYILRIFCSTCIFLAFLLFVLEPKDDFDNLDVIITYVLLIASMCLDFIATIMLIFSNMMIVSLLNVKKLSNWIVLLAEHIIRIKKACHKRRHWSIKMPQLNLLLNCLMISAPNKALRQRMISWVSKKLGLLQEIKLYMTWRTADLETYTLQTMQPAWATQEVLEIIASYLQRRLHLSREEFNKPVGFSALRQVTTIDDWAIVPFVQLFEGLSLDQQVLIWNITTKLCFHWNPKSQHPLYPHRIEMKAKENRLGGVKRISSEMKACKYISNYMMHIVVMQSDMMSTMGGASSMLFWNAIDDMVRFIRGSCDGHHMLMSNAKVEEVCMKMMDTPIDWVNNKSLFVIARVLAHLMFVISEEERWGVITTAWVELLMKGAKNSKANIHMKQLSKGDELLTFIWLFNKHVEIEDTYIPIHDVLVDHLEKAKYLLSEIELHLQ